MDFIRPGGRTDLLAMSDAAGLPRRMADSLYAFIPRGDGQLVSMGHVPRPLLQQALSLPDRPAGLVIWQPQMHGEPVEYWLWAFAGQPQTFPISTPVAQALSQIDIAVIFGVYFAIGLGLMQAVHISSDPHFVARLGSWLLIALGGVNLQEWLWPETPLKLHLPGFAHGKVNQLLKKASIPATIGVGFILTTDFWLLVTDYRRLTEVSQ